jgi:hypothetical protein
MEKLPEEIVRNKGKTERKNGCNIDKVVEIAAEM